MAVVRINAIEVPEGMGERIEQMFAKRLGTVDQEPGFLGFELLRPSGENERRYYVVTRWETDEAFDNWVNSENFQHGHRGAEGAGQQGPPVSSGAELLSFDVVLSSQPHG
ncbi:MAG: antibiotic biosynthesis monooxygenase [Actinomycetia bacterium]|nr:antibiotic biosynthesis monooxygenase [Actinomycetes bacterium]